MEMTDAAAPPAFTAPLLRSSSLFLFVSSF
jgi:hypothetical protein